MSANSQKSPFMSPQCHPENSSLAKIIQSDPAQASKSNLPIYRTPKSRETCPVNPGQTIPGNTKTQNSSAPNRMSPIPENQFWTLWCLLTHPPFLSIHSKSWEESTAPDSASFLMCASRHRGTTPTILQHGKSCMFLTLSTGCYSVLETSGLL